MECLQLPEEQKQADFQFCATRRRSSVFETYSKYLKVSQSAHLTALICQDRTHIEKLRNEHQQRLEGARKTRNSLVEDRKTKELGRLRKENTRHAGILKQYEELIRKLVEKDLVRQELERQGLQDPIQLDANKRDDLDSQAKKLAARHLEDARIDASRTSNYSAP